MSAVLAVTGEAIEVPKIAYSAISPMLIVFGAALVGVLIDAFAPARLRWALHFPVAMGSLIAALAAVVIQRDTSEVVANGALAIDGPTLFLQGTILLLSIAGLLLLADRSQDVGGGAFVAQAATLPGSSDERALERRAQVQTEVFPLTMFAVGGMLLFPAANDLILMFIALEVLSLPLYLLCGLARRRRLLSQEAAVKYFLLGAFSSAFFLYGVALLYGYAGTVNLGGIHDAVSIAAGNEALLYLGVAMLGVGLLFKISAAPFHSWTPDVYQGAPTPVTALMAAGTKVAAFGAMLRVFYVAFGNLTWDWRPVMWGVAILTMVVGSVLAITQQDVKRMLAYSSVAHAGFLLTGVIATNQQGLSGTLFYLLAYGFTTLGAFAVVTLVRDADGEATHLSSWAGLARRSPLVATVFAFFLLALAGIPLTSGFIGKYAVFFGAIQGGATVLVIVGLVTSAIAAFFYVRVIVLMFFQEPTAEGPTVAVPSALTAAAVAVGLAVTVALGVYPDPVLELADSAQIFIR